jgi:hypothetical protein
MTFLLPCIWFSIGLALLFLHWGRSLSKKRNPLFGNLRQPEGKSFSPSARTQSQEIEKKTKTKQ